MQRFTPTSSLVHDFDDSGFFYNCVPNKKDRRRLICIHARKRLSTKNPASQLISNANVQRLKHPVISRQAGPQVRNTATLRIAGHSEVLEMKATPVIVPRNGNEEHEVIKLESGGNRITDKDAVPPFLYPRGDFRRTPEIDACRILSRLGSDSPWGRGKGVFGFPEPCCVTV